MKRTFTVSRDNNPAWERVVDNLYAWVVAQSADHDVRVVVGEPTRPLELNDKMWAMLGDIAAQVEWPVDGVMQKLPAEDWKGLLTAGLKKQQRVAAGIEGGLVILGTRTSRMTKRTMSELLELIQFFGDSKGVVWSDPLRADPSCDELEARAKNEA